MRTNQAPDPRPTLAAPPNEEYGGESSVFEQASVALIGVEGTRIAAFNSAAEQLFYRSADAVRGKELSCLFASFHAAQLEESLRLASRGVPSFPSLLASRGHAAPTEVDVRVGPLCVGGKIVGATLVVLDVRTQNRSLRELKAERDSARAAEADAIRALRELDEVSSGTFVAIPDISVQEGDPRHQRDTLVPGLLLERALPENAEGILDLSEALYRRYDGQPRLMFRVVRKIVTRACEGGAMRMRGQIQASRADWSLLRVEIVESADVQRAGKEWADLRRRVTELEGGLGHEPYGCGQRRIWMTFNLKSLGTRSSRPPHPLFHNVEIALDLKSTELFDAFSRRLRAWKARPVRYAPTRRGALVISDSLPAGPRVIRVGMELPQPVLRTEFRDVILSALKRCRASGAKGQISSRPLKSSSAPEDEPSSYESSSYPPSS